MSTCTPQFRRNSQFGFTLIELMITVAIVGILAAIALPSFNEQIAKSRRATAKATLLSAQQWVERFYSENYSYAANSANTAIDDASQFGARFTTSPPPGEGTAMYNITLGTPLVVSSYSISATRATSSNMASDRCGDYTIDNYGRKSLVNWSTSKFADLAAAINYCWN